MLQNRIQFSSKKVQQTFTAYRKNGTQDPKRTRTLRTQNPMRTRDPMRTQDAMRTQDPRRTQNPMRIQDQDFIFELKLLRGKPGIF